MMNYNEFKAVVEEKFMGYLPQEYQNNVRLHIQSTNKINEVLDGLRLEPLKGCDQQFFGAVVSPMIYINHMYEQFLHTHDLEQVLYSNALLLVREIKKGAYMEALLDFSKAKENIVFQLINTEQNKEMLNDIPSRTFLDMSIIYRWVLTTELAEYASCVVNKGIMDKLKLTEEQLFNLAKENTKRILSPTVTSMQEIVCRELGICGDDDAMNEFFSVQDEMPAMYVLGNSRGIHGASTILYEDVLEETSNLIGGDFYILPSSIQEVIAVPAADYMDADNWAEMVVDVNMTQVELNERLSNQVYFYDSSTHKLGLATAMKNTRLDDVVA